MGTYLASYLARPRQPHGHVRLCLNFRLKTAEPPGTIDRLDPLNNDVTHDESPRLGTLQAHQPAVLADVCVARLCACMLHGTRPPRPSWPASLSSTLPAREPAPVLPVFHTYLYPSVQGLGAAAGCQLPQPDAASCGAGGGLLRALPLGPTGSKEAACTSCMRCGFETVVLSLHTPTTRGRRAAVYALRACRGRGPKGGCGVGAGVEGEDRGGWPAMRERDLHAATCGMGGGR